jgi:hypothetical protein
MIYLALVVRTEGMPGWQQEAKLAFYMTCLWRMTGECHRARELTNWAQHGQICSICCACLTASVRWLFKTLSVWTIWDVDLTFEYGNEHVRNGRRRVAVQARH